MMADWNVNGVDHTSGLTKSDLHQAIGTKMDQDQLVRILAAAFREKTFVL